MTKREMTDDEREKVREMVADERAIHEQIGQAASDKLYVKAAWLCELLAGHYEKLAVSLIKLSREKRQLLRDIAAQLRIEAQEYHKNMN